MFSLYYGDKAGRTPLRKAEKNASDSLGLKEGTSCPAPLNVPKVKPSYS